jgi:small subunit ribosomal protein S8e
MGITRSDNHKRRLTGGRYNVHQKKKKYEMGRASAFTKLGPKR